MATTEERLKQYEDLYAKAAAYDPTQYAQDFKKAYGEATEYNKDLIAQQAQSLGELQATAPTLRQRYLEEGIQDPVKQMALIAQARQTPLTNWATAANLLTARGNKYSDILSNALGAYTQGATTAQNAAQNAWQLYQDAVSQDQFNRNLAASKASSGSTLENLLSSLYGGETATTSTANTAKQQVLNAINSIKQMRQTSNIEPYMNQYFQEIMNQAGSLGLKLNPEGLWQQLGNTMSKPMTYKLFM